MIKNKIVVIDVIKPFILWEYGGVYFDNDYHLVNSPIKYHKTFDMYAGL